MILNNNSIRSACHRQMAKYTPKIRRRTCSGCSMAGEPIIAWSPDQTCRPRITQAATIVLGLRTLTASSPSIIIIRGTRPERTLLYTSMHDARVQVLMSYVMYLYILLFFIVYCNDTI